MVEQNNTTDVGQPDVDAVLAHIDGLVAEIDGHVANYSLDAAVSAWEQLKSHMDVLDRWLAGGGYPPSRWQQQTDKDAMVGLTGLVVDQYGNPISILL